MILIHEKSTVPHMHLDLLRPFKTAARPSQKRSQLSPACSLATSEQLNSSDAERR